MSPFQYVVKCCVIDEAGVEEYFSLFDYPELIMSEDKSRALTDAALDCSEEIQTHLNVAEAEGKVFGYEILVNEFGL